MQRYGHSGDMTAYSCMRTCVPRDKLLHPAHYGDAIMGAIASQITSLTIVYSTVHSDADQRKHQGSTSLAFVRGIQRGPVNSPHKCPVTRKMFPSDDVIMRIRDVITCACPSCRYLAHTFSSESLFTATLAHGSCGYIFTTCHLKCIFRQVTSYFWKRSVTSYGFTGSQRLKGVKRA